MSSVVISGDTSGAITLSAPAVAGTTTLTLQAATATNAVNTLATAVASTSGTSIDFTSIPSWVKRITVMFAGVSTNGSSNILIRIGSGSFISTGYVSSVSYCGAGQSTATSTAGFVIAATGAGQAWNGVLNISLLNASNYTYCESGVISDGANYSAMSGGNIALSGILDRVRITTVNGTDTFDAGTVNILYEG
jgi:hypothetical protein